MNKELHNNMKTKRRFNRKHSSITEIKLLYLLTSWKTIIKNRLVSDHITLKTLHNWDKEVALIKILINRINPCCKIWHIYSVETYVCNRKDSCFHSINFSLQSLQKHFNIVYVHIHLLWQSHSFAYLNFFLRVPSLWSSTLNFCVSEYNLCQYFKI